MASALTSQTPLCPSTSDFWFRLSTCPARTTGRHHPTGQPPVPGDRKLEPTRRPERLYHEFKELLNKVGMASHHLLDENFSMEMNIPVAGCAHQEGTCRFGTDPETSVLDVNCKAHELDNPYVVDTSFFPSIGAVNPVRTAMANVNRVGEHPTERMR